MRKGERVEGKGGERVERRKEEGRRKGKERGRGWERHKGRWRKTMETSLLSTYFDVPRHLEMRLLGIVYQERIRTGD